MKTLSFVLVVGVAALGCGGAEKQPTLPGEAVPAVGGEPAEKHGAMSPEIHAFHEVLSPKWHAPADQARKDATCGAVADFKAKAAAVKGAPAPTGADATQWTNAGVKLEASVVALEPVCAGTDLAAFDAAFKTLHDDFHAAMELGAGARHEGQEHGHEHPHAPEAPAAAPATP